jgi:DNA-binding NtrC family response regulator
MMTTMTTPADMPSAPQPSPARKSVMIVDDDPSMLRLISTWVTGAGHDVVSFSEFAEAKSYLATARPDVIIADVRLKAFNGLQLVIQATMEHPEITAIVLTGFYDSVIAAEVSKLGATYLVKPIRSEALLEKLR